MASAPADASRRRATENAPRRFWSSDRQAALGLAVVLVGIVLLRVPSFFEPPWHSDEGIFAAVAQRVVEGGNLYADAWESKPPLFLYLYAGLFKVFEPGVFPLRLASTLSCLGTVVALYSVGCILLDRRRAIIASAVAGALLSVPFWEGTLALTEIFAILPSTLAVLCLLRWDRALPMEASDRRLYPSGRGWLLLAGLLLGATFLLRQTAPLVGVAVGMWLILRGRPWLTAATWLTVGFAAFVVPLVLVFVAAGTFSWFWDANVTFFFKYVPSGKELPIAYRPIIVLPVFVTVGCLLWYRRREGSVPTWGLPAVWFVLTLASAMLTGRAYSHYMLQLFPPLGLLVSTIATGVRLYWRPTRLQAPAMALVAAIALEWALVVPTMFNGNIFAMHYTRGINYYEHFIAWSLGIYDDERYYNYFDRRVNMTLQLEEKLEELHAEGAKTYIWGEYPWVYPLAKLEPADRYVTSFYILLLPYLDLKLGSALAAERPNYIIMLDDAKPIFASSSQVIDWRYSNATRALYALIARDYRWVERVGKAQIFVRNGQRLTPTPTSGITVQPITPPGDSDGTN